MFAVSAHDAGAVLDAAASFDLHDPLAREASSAELRSFGPKPRFGVPPSDDLDFFGDREAESLFAAATATLEQVGGTRCKSAFAPFRNAGRLLYNGPWLAERLHATQALLDDDPDAILPVTRSIIERGRHYSALDAYRAQYELAQLKREADVAFKSIDMLLLPTTGTIYETAAVAADPLRLNANLVLYTSFVNLLDLGVFAKTGSRSGVSLFAPAFAERALLDLTARFHA